MVCEFCDCTCSIEYDSEIGFMTLVVSCGLFICLDTHDLIWFDLICLSYGTVNSEKCCLYLKLYL